MKTIQEDSNDSPLPAGPGKYLVAVLVAALGLAYTVALVLGYIPEQRRIDMPNLFLLILAGACAGLIINPGILKRMTKFKLGDMEWELDNLKLRQKEQAQQLDAINLLLPLMLRDQETADLRRLAEGKTKGYVGSHDLRTELRRLSTMGLIERRKDRKIGEMTDNRQLDVADFVRLTAFGERLVEKLKEIDEGQGGEAKE